MSTDTQIQAPPNGSAPPAYPLNPEMAAQIKGEMVARQRAALLQAQGERVAAEANERAAEAKLAALLEWAG